MRHAYDVLAGGFILWLIFIYREAITDPHWKHNARMYRWISVLLMIAFAWWCK
jgi:hypothetical protein